MGLDTPVPSHLGNSIQWSSMTTINVVHPYHLRRGSFEV